MEYKTEVKRVEKFEIDMKNKHILKFDKYFIMSQQQVDEEWMEQLQEEYPDLEFTGINPVQLIGDMFYAPTCLVDPLTYDQEDLVLSSTKPNLLIHWNPYLYTNLPSIFKFLDTYPKI